MLPFLKLKQEGSASTPVESIKREHDEDKEESFDDLESCCEELIEAIHSKNAKAVKEALKAAFQLFELEPHEEGPHEG